MRRPAEPRTNWYRAGTNGELKGPFSDRELLSLASRGLIFPDTPVAHAEAGALPTTWSTARERVPLAVVFYEAGSMLLQPAAPPPAKALVERAPLVLSDHAATRHHYLTLRARAETLFRCVGDMVDAWMHFGADKRPMICLGSRCKICPDRRVRNAFFDALMHSMTNAGDHFFRACLALPEGAWRQLQLPPGETHRGRLYGVRWVPGKETVVDLLQLQCPPECELDQAADVRFVVRRKYGLDNLGDDFWPDYGSNSPPPTDPNVLPFRRQA